MPISFVKMAVLMASALLVSCAPAQSSGQPATRIPLSTTTPQPSLPATPTQQATGVTQAIADLAARLGTTPAEIKVVTQEAVTWPDKSLGCAQPGIEYTQVPVDGLRLVLDHGGQTYEYHIGSSRWVTCEPIELRPPLTKVPLQLDEVFTPELGLTPTLHIESGLQPQIDAALTALATRLSISRETIEVMNAQSVVWPDRSLGCPQPGMVYPQVLVEGFRIELRANNQVYAYHGGEGHQPFLCENPAK